MSEQAACDRVCKSPYRSEVGLGLSALMSLREVVEANLSQSAPSLSADFTILLFRWLYRSLMRTLGSFDYRLLDTSAPKCLPQLMVAKSLLSAQSQARKPLSVTNHRPAFWAMFTVSLDLSL
jgi:hypothetical protein